MKIIGVVIISPLWGIIGAQLLLQSWLAFANLIITAIGFIRGKVKRTTNLIGMGVAGFQILLFSGLMWLGSYVLSEIFSFGYTSTENVVFWIFAVLSFIYMLPQIPAKIKKGWRNANEPGSIESSIFKRRFGTPDESEIVD